MKRHSLQLCLAGLVLLAGLLVSSCAASRSDPTMVSSGDLTLSAALEPASGRVGENTLWLELRDKAGRPIDRADVTAKVHMHAMGAMPAMGGTATISAEGGGRYRADFELDMGSTWRVEVRAKTQDGSTLRADGSLTVGTPGLRLQAVGSPSEPDAPPSATGDVREEPTAHPGEFRFDLARLQRIGVRTGAAETRVLELEVHALGRIAYDETVLRDVSSKVRGWVRELYADSLGSSVERGSVLLTLYSPELLSAQEEYLQALRSQQAARQTRNPERADYLVRAARRRLHLWDISEADIDEIARRGESRETLPLRAPTSGFIIEKNVVEGSAVEPGARLFRIAPLERVWLEAELYEAELALITVGQSATVTLPYLPGRVIEGTVSYVYPYLEGDTRTARIRVELPNPDRSLRPDMYADVDLRVDAGRRLTVPTSAVLFAGRRQFVFRDLGGGRFRPQQVELGIRGSEQVEVLSGLSAGDRVVTSGTFLIASESRLRSAMENW